MYKWIPRCIKGRYHGCFCWKLAEQYLIYQKTIFLNHNEKHCGKILATFCHIFQHCDNWPQIGHYDHQNVIITLTSKYKK